MSGFSDYLRKHVGPSIVVRASRLRGGMRLSAALRRALGGRPRMKLFFAYDDPYAAVAIDGVLALAARHHADLQIYPLCERGIADDPALDKRHRHAIVDSQRLALRNKRSLKRLQPLDARDCAFLAEWTEAARGNKNQATFAAAALDQLWFGSSGAVQRDAFQPLRQNLLGNLSESGTVAALTRNAQLMDKLGHWESPAALVEGEWFFAHERLEQMEEHLEDLGW